MRPRCGRSTGPFELGRSACRTRTCLLLALASLEALLSAGWACRSRSGSADQQRAANTAAVLWSVATGARPPVDAGPVVAADGLIYVGGVQGARSKEVPARAGEQHQACLLAFDAEGRTVRTLEGGIAPETAPVSVPTVWWTLSSWGTVYGIDSSGGLYGFVGGGEALYRETGLALKGPPVVNSAGRVFAGGPGGLRGFDIQGFELLGLHVPTGSSHASAAALASDGALVFTSSSGGRVYVVDAGGTVVEWEARGGFTRPAVDPEGNVYIAKGSTLSRYSRGGVVAWQFSAQSPLQPPTVGPDGTVYVLTETGLMHAVSATGSELWSYPLGAGVSGAVAFAGDSVWIPERSGRLHVLETNGRRQAIFDTAPGPSTPAFGPDGTIYVACSDGKLHALRRS